MANKNHALDGQIAQAALQEFLQCGYEKASLRKIAAAAGVTIGAIYTRYPTKDDLFCSLVQPLILRIQEAFGTIRNAYYSGPPAGTAGFLGAITQESDAILHLLFDDYDRALLLLCRSAGSSLEHFFDRIVEEKIRETVLFFQSTGSRQPDPRVLKLLITAQFHMYVQILQEGYPLDDARRILCSVTDFSTGGWLSLLGSAEERNQEV